MYAIIQLLLFLVILPVGLSAAAGDVLVFYAVEAGGFEISVLFLLLHVYTSFRIVLLSRHVIKNISQICFHLFVYIWIVAVPSMQMYYNEWPKDILLSADTHALLLIMVSLSILTFEFGYLFSRRVNIKVTKYIIVNVPNQGVLYAIFFFYTIIFSYIVVRVGDLSLLMGARIDPFEDAGIARGGTARLITDALFRVPSVVLSLVLFSLYLSGAYRHVRRFWWLTAVAAVMLVISNFPTAVPRVRFGSTAIAFLVLWFIHKRPQVANWFPAIMAAGILVVFPLLGQTRRQLDLQALNWADVRRSYFSGGFDAYQMMGIIVDYTDVYGVQQGRQLAGALLFWIPRSVWPDKPIGTGAQVATDLGLSFTNLSAPLWAEAYINFGIAGVFVAFFILGWICRAISYAFLDKKDMLIILGAFFVGFQFFLLRGDLMSSFTVLLPFAIFTLVVFWHARPLPTANWNRSARRNGDHYA